MDSIIVDVNIFEEFSKVLSEVWIEKIALNSLSFGLLSLNSEFIHDYHSRINIANIIIFISFN